MVYFFLLLLALVFALLGFFFRAFLFGGTQDPALLQEVAMLKKALVAKQNEYQGAQQEIVETQSLARSLQDQIRKRDAETESLKLIVFRQEDDLRQLQKDTLAMRAAVTGTRKRSDASTRSEFDLEETSAKIAQAVPGAEERPSAQHVDDKPSPSSSGDAEAPPWRNDLRNIRHILDSVEKELDK